MRIRALGKQVPKRWQECKVGSALNLVKEAKNLFYKIK